MTEGERRVLGVKLAENRRTPRRPRASQEACGDMQAALRVELRCIDTDLCVGRRGRGHGRVVGRRCHLRRSRAAAPTIESIARTIAWTGRQTLSEVPAELRQRGRRRARRLPRPFRGLSRSQSLPAAIDRRLRGCRRQRGGNLGDLFLVARAPGTGGHFRRRTARVGLARSRDELLSRTRQIMRQTQ